MFPQNRCDSVCRKIWAPPGAERCHFKWSFLSARKECAQQTLTRSTGEVSSAQHAEVSVVVRTEDARSRSLSLCLSPYLGTCLCLFLSVSVSPVTISSFSSSVCLKLCPCVYIPILALFVCLGLYVLVSASVSCVSLSVCLSVCSSGMHFDLTLLHSCTFVSLVTEFVCAVDHSSSAFALAPGCATKQSSICHGSGARSSALVSGVTWRPSRSAEAAVA